MGTSQYEVSFRFAGLSYGECTVVNQLHTSDVTEMML